MSEIVVCTIITKNYLADARTLAETLEKHNPGSKLFVLLADHVDDYFDPKSEPFTLIQLEDLDEPTLDAMCFYYKPFELCCALRGALHEYMMKRTHYDRWIFLDSDIMICHSLDGIFDQLGKTSILLNPNCTKPVNVEFASDYELVFLDYGLYSGGFLGLRRTTESQKFISWFKERLRYYALDAVPSGQYLDQLWLNFVPLYFSSVDFLLDAGANIAFWNLFERKFEKTADGTITVNGEPLLFVHFSNWNMKDQAPKRVLKYASKCDAKILGFWEEFTTSYRNRLLANGYETVRRYPYAFSHFRTGERISRKMRLLYREDVMRGKKLASSPFDDYHYFRKRLRQINPALIYKTGKRFVKRAAEYLGYSKTR